MASQERRERLWDSVYAQVFASQWAARAMKVMPDHYQAALEGVSSDAAKAADDAVKQLGTDSGWGPRDA